MDKYVYNKNNGLWHELQGDRKVTYTALLTIEKLSNYLADVTKMWKKNEPEYCLVTPRLF